MDHYITQIKIEKLRHLSDIDIALKPDVRTNLLLTGKNGSGKTTVLQALKLYLTTVAGFGSVEESCQNGINEDKGSEYGETAADLSGAQKQLMAYREQLQLHEDGVYVDFVKIKGSKGQKQRLLEYFRQLRLSGLGVDFKNKDEIEGLFHAGKFILAYYGADRKTGIMKEKSVEDVILDTSYSMDSNPGKVLLKYLVHLKTQQAYARNENDMATVHMLDQWFARFVDALKVLLDNQSIEIKYDYKNYNFKILESGREEFGFDELSDGYSAAIQIVADLILRMEQNWLKKGELSSYDVEGIVLIDELETHLHIGLQKTILPFLTSFFPKIQFIVSTHSPYILNSIENCVIYDLENRIRMEDMSQYSAEGIVEGYFEQDSYSEVLMEKVRRYQELVEIADPTDEERAERAVLFTEFKQLSGDLSREAKSAFDEIEDRRKQNDKIYS